MLSSCSLIRTDAKPEPTPDKSGTITANADGGVGANAYELKQASRTVEAIDTNMNNSKYANFENTIDNLLEIVRE